MSLRKGLAVFLCFSDCCAAICRRKDDGTTAAPSGATVHGMVVDPDDALIPGATVTLTSSSGKAQTTTSKSDGTYSFRGVAAGTYTVTAMSPGFGNLPSRRST